MQQTASYQRQQLAEAAPDMLRSLEYAIARVELANREGDPILSAWLEDARNIVARAKVEP